jgi:hypothetical protein
MFMGDMALLLQGVASSYALFYLVYPFCPRFPHFPPQSAPCPCFICSPARSYEKLLFIYSVSSDFPLSLSLTPPLKNGVLKGQYSTYCYL